MTQPASPIPQPPNLTADHTAMTEPTHPTLVQNGPEKNGRSPLSRAMSRLGVRGRLFGLAITLAALGIVCAVVATSGLLGEKGKVHSVNTTFNAFRTERDAYEGWLTADDQMNMYAALGVLHDPHQRQLANVTWGQVVDGHAQAIRALNWLVAHGPTPAIKAKAQTTLSDVYAYYGFTQRMHAALLAGNPTLAV